MVVKGVRFRNHRVMGDIIELARRYRDEGADELVFYDITASPDGRTVDRNWVNRVAEVLDIPFCVAGGIRNLADAETVLNLGADKISINSPALANPDLINVLARRFGSQCVVVGVDSFAREPSPRRPPASGSAVAAATVASCSPTLAGSPTPGDPSAVPDQLVPGDPPAVGDQSARGDPSAVTDQSAATGLLAADSAAPIDYAVYQYTGDPNRSRTSGRRTLDWIVEAQDRGAGEIVLNCMNRDGVRTGYDLEQLARVREVCQVPLIASGGAGAMEHFREVFERANVDGALAASVFHTAAIPIPALKRYLIDAAIPMRPPEEE